MTGQENFLNTYASLPIVIEKGVGNKLIDDQGNEYLDFVAGIATNALGYGYQPLKDAIKAQVDQFTHCSNLYYNQPALDAAKKLVELSGLHQVFFCNSGAEANEAALKLAKRYNNEYGNGHKKTIVTMENSFHGRTIATVSATGQKKYHEGFSPLFDYVKYSPFNDLAKLEEALTEDVGILMVEPIQGEGGIRPSGVSFLQGVRKLCDDKGVVLIFDEVQCGIGRTGTVFAYEHYGIKPDIVSLAKGLGAGFAVGAIIANEKVSKGFVPGTHASTFGGNPIATTAANVVLDALVKEQVLDNVVSQGAYLENELNHLKDKFDFIIDVRGKGLMLAIELNRPVKDFIMKALDQKLLIINSGTHVIRFVPPLTITKEEIDQMIQILISLFEQV